MAQTKTEEAKFVWIPEAPRYPGLYANESDHTDRGKLFGPLQPSTGVAQQAKHFDTEEECRKWCNDNPVPAFVPVEHGFE